MGLIPMLIWLPQYVLQLVFMPDPNSISYLNFIDDFSPSFGHTSSSPGVTNLEITSKLEVADFSPVHLSLSSV